MSDEWKNLTIDCFPEMKLFTLEKHNEDWMGEMLRVLCMSS